jgi:AraC family transcriptional regulator
LQASAWRPSDHFSSSLADKAGVDRTPPLPELVVLGELAQAAADGRSDVGLDEAGLLLAARFVEIMSDKELESAAGTARDRRRAVRAALDPDGNNVEAVCME